LGNSTARAHPRFIDSPTTKERWSNFFHISGIKIKERVQFGVRAASGIPRDAAFLRIQEKRCRACLTALLVTALQKVLAIYYIFRDFRVFRGKTFEVIGKKEKNYSFLRQGDAQS
jgi:hypothetical protein